MVIRGRGTELAEKSVFLDMSAALDHIGKDWVRRDSRVNNSTWKRKSKKLQNIKEKKVGIHKKILPTCPGYVSNRLPAGSWSLQRLTSGVFVLCSKS